MQGGPAGGISRDSGITAIVNAFNPCLLILGGGIIKGFPEFISIVEIHVHKHALAAAVAPFKIVRPALGDASGVIGAAAFARHIFEETLDADRG